MLVGVYSFLEETIQAIAKRRLPDYDRKIKAQEKGSRLRKHIRVLSKSVALNVAAIQSEVDTSQDLIRLRNCITHAWGKVAEAQNPVAVGAATQRIDTAAISRDGYLVFGNQVVPLAIIAAENIVENILPSIGPPPGGDAGLRPITVRPPLLQAIVYRFNVAPTRVRYAFVMHSIA